MDEDALIEALKNKKIAGAGLDVFAQEPLPADSPLNKMDNVGTEKWFQLKFRILNNRDNNFEFFSSSVLSPHIACNSGDCLNSMGELAALNVIAVLNGTKMPAEVL